MTTRFSVQRTIHYCKKGVGVFFLLGIGVLGGCTFFNADKPPLPGKRESIFQDSNAPKKDILSISPKEESYKENANWPVIGGAFNHVPGPIKLSSAFSKRERKSFRTKKAQSIGIMQPLIQGNTLYLLNYKNEVKALNAKDLSLKWDFKPPLQIDSPLVGAIGVFKDKILLSTPEGKVFALNRHTGALIWKKDMEEPLRGAPTLSGTNVILQSKNNKVYGISLESGDVKWMVSVPSESLSFLRVSNPSVYNGKILVTLTSGDVLMLRGDNGAILWQDKLDIHANKDELSLLANIQALPLLDNIYAFIINQQQLVAFDQRNGHQLWEEPIGGSLTPAVGENHLFVLDNRGYVIALEKSSGRISWSKNLEKKSKNLYGPYITSSGILVFNGKKALFLDIQDGSLKKETTLESAPVVSPSIANNTLYVLSADQSLTIYK